MNTPNKTANYGLIIEPTEIDHYVFGGSSISQDILQADGQWDAFLPVYEPQFGDGWDTDGCTVWGTLNALEIISKKIYGTDTDYSERFTYNMVPVRPPGSDPHKVAECIRKNGVVDNALLPMTTTYEDFIRPVSSNLIEQAKRWLKEYEICHEWLFSLDIKVTDTKKTMMEALRLSPLGVSVTAWKEVNGLYVDDGRPNNHWCVCFGYVENEYWKIFDSYDQTIKKLAWDFNFQCSKRYRVVKRPVTTNLWNVIINFISKLWIQKN